ncbi:cysteine desulfurase family protein [Flectobacillus sp. BAB-3569]|uniref:cysteine desulfurase family protein n=1 Tax=Flectobacillus sp. BAB-3569 TaxID=1509483 RepID=UPI000BA2BCC5|nr:IscS subfamily cysteine desulfurase [Flectobacillus sp. BAB-3569]PAC27341.1 IscS subfamily cysteine desulfurase [Flectobacillus sp. BAB-3569]
MKLPVYLDYNATTPVDERVLAEMLPWFTQNFGNAASRSHLYGWQAEEAVSIARMQVAKLLGASEKDIVFTSGATESNNLAIKGVFEALGKEKNHIITIATEHKAILDVCTHLEQFGARITVLLPDSDGLITTEQITDAIEADTLLVSAMYANNETGVIFPIEEIAKICRERNIFFHTDATQAVGKLPINLRNTPIDLLSLSAHKLYGAKGIGALYVNRNNPKLQVIAQMDGGKHERGMRSGTLNVPGIVSLGKACDLARLEMKNNQEKLSFLRYKLEQSILSKLENTSVNGGNAPRLAHVTNIAFGGVDGEMLLGNLKNIAVSSGSACTSASVLPSHVLKAMGINDDLAYSSIRFSLGKYTTEEEIDFAINHVVEVIEKMR